MNEKILTSRIQLVGGVIFPIFLLVLGSYGLQHFPVAVGEINYGAIFFVGVAVFIFVSNNWYSVWLFDDRIEKKYLFTRAVETIELSDIHSWYEGYHAGRYSYFYLTLYANDKELTISQRVIGNYDEFKSKLNTTHIPVNKNPPENKWDWVLIIAGAALGLVVLLYYAIKFLVS